MHFCSGKAPCEASEPCAVNVIRVGKQWDSIIASRSAFSTKCLFKMSRKADVTGSVVTCSRNPCASSVFLQAPHSFQT